MKKDGTKVRLFESAYIYTETRLTHGGMILIALLCGGDYDQVSVPTVFIHANSPLILSLTGWGA